MVRNIETLEITKPDPTNHPEQIVIKGVSPESSSELRNLVQDRLAEYDAASGVNNVWTVTMKQGDEWKQLIEATWVRKEAKTP